MKTNRSLVKPSDAGARAGARGGAGRQQAYDNKGGGMSYRNARLANGFLSLDEISAGRDMSKFRPLSDRGEGVAKMLATLDYNPVVETLAELKRVTERRRKIDAARQKLRRMGLEYLVPTLMLICKNGRWRDESIREIAATRNLSFESAKRLYFGHREKILKTLCA